MKVDELPVHLTLFVVIGVTAALTARPRRPRETLNENRPVRDARV
jgi:hypothetical protein